MSAVGGATAGLSLELGMHFSDTTDQDHTVFK